MSVKHALGTSERASVVFMPVNEWNNEASSAVCADRKEHSDGIAIVGEAQLRLVAPASDVLFERTY